MDWSNFIAVNGATAHPHYDPDGTVYNMGNSYGKDGKLCDNYIFIHTMLASVQLILAKKTWELYEILLFPYYKTI